MQERELRAPDVIPVDKVASLQPANQGPAKQEPLCQKPRIFCKMQGKQLSLTMSFRKDKRDALINWTKITGLKPNREKPGKVQEVFISVTVKGWCMKPVAWLMKSSE